MSTIKQDSSMTYYTPNRKTNSTSKFIESRRKKLNFIIDVTSAQTYNNQNNVTLTSEQRSINSNKTRSFITSPSSEKLKTIKASTFRKLPMLNLNQTSTPKLRLNETSSLEPPKLTTEASATIETYKRRELKIPSIVLNSEVSPMNQLRASELLDLESRSIEAESLGNLQVDPKELAESLLKTLQEGIELRKNKPKLDMAVTQAIKIAQKLKYTTLYLELLKMYGKILFLYSDIHKAIVTFRLLRKNSEVFKQYLYKMKAYKHLGLCFHHVENPRMAIFYFTKLLQTAWMTENRMYELLAYDLIGLQHFYLGELEKSKYYHDKMMDGGFEPENSELRKVGVRKLINKMIEPHTLKKVLKVKTVEEELTAQSQPASEDEFELPSPRGLDQPLSINISKEKQIFDKKIYRLEKVNAMKKLLALGNKGQKEPTPVFRDSRDMSSLKYTINSNSLLNPPRPQIILSHLSPNRFLNNFHISDPKLIAYSFINRDQGTGIQLLDTKSLDKIKSLMEKVIKICKKKYKSLLNLNTSGGRSSVKRDNARLSTVKSEELIFSKVYERSIRPFH